MICILPGNNNQLRGSVLTIYPKIQGTYHIPILQPGEHRRESLIHLPDARKVIKKGYLGQDACPSELSFHIR